MKIYLLKPSQGSTFLSEVFHTLCHLKRWQRPGICVPVQLFRSMHNRVAVEPSARGTGRGRIVSVQPRYRWIVSSYVYKPEDEIASRRFSFRTSPAIAGQNLSLIYYLFSSFCSALMIQQCLF